MPEPLMRPRRAEEDSGRPISGRQRHQTDRCGQQHAHIQEKGRSLVGPQMPVRIWTPLEASPRDAITSRAHRQLQGNSSRDRRQNHGQRIAEHVHEEVDAREHEQLHPLHSQSGGPQPANYLNHNTLPIWPTPFRRRKAAHTDSPGKCNRVQERPSSNTGRPFRHSEFRLERPEHTDFLFPGKCKGMTVQARPEGWLPSPKRLVRPAPSYHCSVSDSPLRTFPVSRMSLDE